eukprot:comp22390_c0_seq1/m.54392 comp22390_c0_seq1/g.54392  ORF comp22390_c0_seq1/g.54392 comp22390_c0_seq1/m.54392 type:complete len:441 (-) comp22390_c0_seq1:33-1355(-)
MGLSTGATICLVGFVVNAALLGFILGELKATSHSTRKIDSTVQEVAPHAKQLIESGKSFMRFYDSATQLVSGSAIDLANRVLRKDYAGFGQNVTQFAAAVRSLVANHTGFNSSDEARVAVKKTAIHTEASTSVENPMLTAIKRFKMMMNKDNDDVISLPSSKRQHEEHKSHNMRSASGKNNRHVVPSSLRSPATPSKGPVELPACTNSQVIQITTCSAQQTYGECRSTHGCNWSSVYTAEIRDFNGTECVKQEIQNVIGACFPDMFSCQVNLGAYNATCPPSYLPFKIIYEYGSARFYDLPFVNPPGPPGPQPDIVGANNVYAVSDFTHSLASVIAKFKDVTDPASVPVSYTDNGLVLDVADYALSFAQEQLNIESWVRLAATCEEFATSVLAQNWSGSYIDAYGDEETWDANDGLNNVIGKIKQWCTLAKSLGTAPSQN